MGGFKVIGLAQIRKRMRIEAEKQREKAILAINDIGDMALYGAVEHAPIDEGMLQASLEKSIQEEGSAVHAVIRVPLNSPASAYAGAMHEDFYNLGVKSQKKASRNGLKVGRKYITKGIEYSKPYHKRIIERRMKS